MAGLATSALALACAVTAARAGERGLPPRGELEALVERYLDADFAERARLRAEIDRDFAPLSPPDAAKLRELCLRIAMKHGPRLGRSGENWWYEGGRGRYLVKGRPSKVLFIGLHHEGPLASAEKTPMGGGGWWWIYPEALERGSGAWTRAGTEEFVLELVEAAKRTGRVDPNRIYITGAGMGGEGTWNLGAHHADVFAGAAAYGGTPVPYANEADGEILGFEEGVLPNLFNLRVFGFGWAGGEGSATSVALCRELDECKARFPDGFEYRFAREEGSGKPVPDGGYLPSLKWIAERERDPRPRAFLWQPKLRWKRHHFWAYWDRPEEDALLEFRAKEGNRIEVTTHGGSGDVTGLSILLGEPLARLEEEVVITVNGEERFRGRVERTLSTLLLTAPRYDEHLLFDARVDLQ